MAGVKITDHRRNVACNRGQDNQNTIDSASLNVHIDYKKVTTCS